MTLCTITVFLNKDISFWIDLDFTDEEEGEGNIPRRDETQGAAEAMMELSAAYQQQRYLVSV